MGENNKGKPPLNQEDPLNLSNNKTKVKTNATFHLTIIYGWGWIAGETSSSLFNCIDTVYVVYVDRLM